jgi:ADP-ribose pyrophosphatase
MKMPTIIDENILYKGKFLELKQLQVAQVNGKITPYEVVTRNTDKVFWIISVLPITNENEIVMIRQYRSPLDRVGIEFPAGCAEVGKHESLEHAVHSELREETGYQAGQLAHIAEFSSSSGMTDETVHGFVATNCRKVSDILELDGDECIERLVIPYSDFDWFILSEIARGAIIEPKMLAMMWWYRWYLQNWK